MKYLRKMLSASLFVSTGAWAVYVPLPNLAYPPDTSLTMSTPFDWKGTTFNGLKNNAHTSTANTSSLTGTLNIVASLTPVGGDFPVGVGNLMLQGFAKTDVSSSKWVRAYSIMPTPLEVTSSGTPTGFYTNDLLIYSKEEIGSPPAEVNGLYVGPSYNFHTGAPTVQFATLKVGSLVTTSGIALPDIVDSSESTRNDSSQFVLTGVAGSNYISTFSWTPETSDLKIQALASNTVTPGSLGSNMLLLGQCSTYSDTGYLTLTPSSNKTFTMGSFFKGTGDFNRDSKSAIHESYVGTPSLIVNSTRTLGAGNYYQYVNNSGLAGSITSSLVVSSGALLEFSGNATLLGGTVNGQGTVLFSGGANTLTLDSTSHFTPALLGIESSSLALVSSLGEVTIAPTGFDLIFGSTLNIGSNVTLQTAPGSSWTSYGGVNSIPAIPVAAKITGEGTLFLQALSATSWQNRGSILVDTLVLDDSYGSTTFVNNALVTVSSVTVQSSDLSYTYIINNYGTFSSDTMVVSAPLEIETGKVTTGIMTLTSQLANLGNLIVTDTVFMDNTSGAVVNFLNYGGASIQAFDLKGGGTAAYEIDPGILLNIGTLTQGHESDEGSANLTFSDMGGYSHIGTWNVTGSSTVAKAFVVTNGSSLQVSNFNLSGYTGTSFLIQDGGSPGSLGIIGEFTLGDLCYFSWQSVNPFQLSGTVNGNYGAIQASDTGSILQITGDLFLDCKGILIGADQIQFIGAVNLSTSGASLLIADSDILIPSTTTLSLDINSSIASYGVITIQGTVFGPAGPAGLGTGTGVTVTAGAILHTGTTSQDVLIITAETSGGLTLQPGSTWIAPVEAGSNQSSQIQVEGDVLLGGGLTLQLSSDKVRAKNTWAILTSTGTIKGEFDTVGTSIALPPNYSLSWYIQGDPVLFATIEATQPFTDGVHCKNPYRVAETVQTVFDGDCASEELDDFIADTLIPYIYDPDHSQSKPFANLGGAEYAAVAEGWLETQLQSLIPMQKWAWVTSDSYKKKNEAWVSTMGAALQNHGQGCEQPKWSGSNAIITMGLGKWGSEANTVAVGVQNQWLFTHAQNLAEGRARIYALEGILSANFCQQKDSFSVYETFVGGGGGGWGHMKRHIDFGSFSSHTKGDFSLLTYKGQLEVGLRFERQSFIGQTFLSASGAGSCRSSVKEKGSVVSLFSPHNTFGVLRFGAGGRIGRLIRACGIWSPELAITGYQQHQYRGKSLEFHFVEGSCSKYSQTAQGLSSFGALVQVALNWQSKSERVDIGTAFNSDLSSNLTTFGGEGRVSLRW